MATTKNSTGQQNMDNSNSDNSRRGNFANMDEKKQREISSKGGKTHGSTGKSHK